MKVIIAFGAWPLVAVAQLDTLDGIRTSIHHKHERTNMKSTTIISMLTAALILGAASQLLRAEDITVITDDGKEMHITNATVRFEHRWHSHMTIPPSSESSFVAPDKIYVTEPVPSPEGVTVTRKSVPMQQIQKIEWISNSYTNGTFVVKGTLTMKDGTQKDYFLYESDQEDEDASLSPDRVEVKGTMVVGGQPQDITFTSRRLKALVFPKQEKK